ncbi:MAG: helix-turn-helix domain-containing protein, partial [Eubacteriales bacterium]|nr:helix-turn-helix domain-containing protein [Eubacteriales bacterium]
RCIMPKDINSIMLNPTRMRIVQTFASHNSMTANEVCEIIHDVPRTTLYRHINILIEAHVLTIVEEKKIRGSMERTLALNIKEIIRQNDAGNISQQAFGFLMGIYAKFEKYFAKDGFVPGNNKVFFNNTVMMMTDGEFDAFLSDLQTLLVRYHYEAADGRKLRDISIISAPPAQDNYGE